MSPPAVTLAGRRALVTGAYGVLGQAIGRRLRAAGADLLITGRDPDRLAAEAAALAAEHPGAGAVERIALDLGAPDAAARLAAAAAGRLDILVNVAAVQGPIGPLWDTDWTAWETALRLDLLAPVALCRAFADVLGRGAGRGKIINISGGGATSPRPGFSAYATAKAGLVRFTESFALEAAGRRIDVNAVAPGAFPSAMTREILAAAPDRCPAREREAARRALDAPEAVALPQASALVAWLASARSDGITGRLLSALWDPWDSLDARAAELAATDIYTLRRIVPADRGRSWEPAP